MKEFIIADGKFYEYEMAWVVCIHVRNKAIELMGLITQEEL